MVTLRQAAEQALEASASPTCNQALQVAARQALEALKTIRPWEVVDYDPLEAAITALRAALAEQPAKAQEPKPSDIFCGVDFEGGVLAVSVLRRRPDAVAEVLHCEQIELTAPQPRRDVELTDEEIDRALDAANVPELPAGYESVELEIARAVIEAYKAKQEK